MTIQAVLANEQQWHVEQGDVLKVLRAMPEECVQTVVTSPPYWGLRDYQVDGQIGLEETPEGYVGTMVIVFREIKRVLRKDGTCWVNMGDSYANASVAGDKVFGNPAFNVNRPSRAATRTAAKRVPPGLKRKDLIGTPWRLAFALQSDGWWLRKDIIWHKPNPMPESCTDRPTSAHEYLFLLTKAASYFYDAHATRERTGNEASWEEWANADGHKMPGGNMIEGVNAGFGAKTSRLAHPAGRNKRSVWTIPTQGFPEAHFATFPEALVTPCILAGTSDKGCCPVCQKPRRRILERTATPTRPALTNVNDPTGMAHRDPERHVTDVRMVGWKVGCDCYDLQRMPYTVTHPCVVLDPFVGSGTTGVVAKRLGRRFIGVELNAEYAEMSRRRIANPDAKRPEPDVEGQGILFEESPCES